MKLTQSKPLPVIASAVKKYLEFISPTYGPAGKKVLISLGEFNTKAIDDGHEASKEFELENELENGVISYIKEATDKTNSRVGDGTTTAVILTAAIVNEVMKDFDDPFKDQNYHGKVKEIEKATKEAIKEIKAKSKQIKTKQELYKIAYNSFNNEEIATLISDTLFKIGADGLLSIEDSQSVMTEIEMVEGLELEKGFASPYLINTEKKECLLTDVKIVLIEKKLEFFKDILVLLKQAVENGYSKICIIADGFGEDALNNCIVSKIRGAFAPLLIEIPGFGDKTETLQNIATITGAKIITKFEDANLDYLGSAKKIRSTKDKSVIIGGAGTKQDIEKRVKLLESKETKNEFEKDKINKQIAILKGGMALIKVGANTEQEQKAIKAKVEDSINATRIAFQEGVVKGAGKTYAEIKTSSQILNEALKVPSKQLEENGKEYLDDNTVDPTGVLVAALETASSIACGLLTIGSILVNKRKEEKD